MLMKLLTAPNGSDPREKSKAAQAGGAVMMALGICGLLTLILLEVFDVFSLEQQVNSYADGLMFGLSGGMIGGGFATFWSARQRLKDPEKMRVFMIKSTDERVIAISRTAAQMTLWTSIALLYIVLIICAFIEPRISIALTVSACAILTIYSLYIYLFSKRM